MSYLINKSITNNTGGGSTTINYSGLIPEENDKLMYSYGGCSLWVRQVPSARRAFDIFVDCSNVDYRDDSPKLLEDSIKFVFQEDYADISVNIKSKCSSLIDDSCNSGDEEDGKIKGRFSL